MKPIPLSVVIPTYNCGQFVAQAVESALAQTVAPAQIIVVDDGSQDDTREQLLPYQRHICYVRQANQGVSAARNHGVRLADGELVAFLDADDVWHPRKTELQMEVFRARPDLGLLGTRSFPWPATEFPRIDGERSAIVAPVTWGQLVVKNRLTTSSVMVRKAFLDRAGPFDTRLQGPEDRDLWLRIADLTSLANLELPLTGYRHVAGSVSRQAARCEAGMRAILGKLEARGAFHGKGLLRRKAYSYVNHSCACIYGEAGDHGRALHRSLASLLWYPLPYSLREGEIEVRFERAKRLLVGLLRVLRLKAAPSTSPHALTAGVPDALQRLGA